MCIEFGHWRVPLPSSVVQGMPATGDSFKLSSFMVLMATCPAKRALGPYASRCTCMRMNVTLSMQAELAAVPLQERSPLHCLGTLCGPSCCICQLHALARCVTVLVAVDEY